MDTGRFDALARGAARASTRRAAFVGLVSAMVGLGARSGAAQVEPEACLGRNDDCSGSGNCCRGLRCPRRSGRCEFRNNHGRERDWCDRNRDCNRGLECDRRRNECRLTCIEPGDRCRRDSDCCDQALCGNRNRCCIVRGATCRQTADCCSGLICSNGICRN